MSLYDQQLAPIDRGYLHATRLTGAITWGVVTLVAGVAGFVMSTAIDWFPIWPLPLVTAVFGLWSVWVAAPRRWARWGWAWTGRELHIASGWITRFHTIVPAARVQHIDVAQGPIDRMFGVATLVLHTAGSASNVVHLPGISRAQAEAIRDAIRQQLSVDPW